jgi:hypothetical protein
MYLTAQQAAYLDSILPNPTINFAWLDYRADGYHHGPILIETKSSLARQLVTRYWAPYGFEGYVLPGKAPTPLTELLCIHEIEDWRLRKSRELQHALVYFEGWNDGCEVRFWTQKMTLEDVRDRLNLTSLESALGKLRNELMGN